MQAEKIKTMNNIY